VPTTEIHPILKGLNEPQREAASHIQGPSLILAGAGSGKTRALTHRIAYMIDQGIQPWQILAVTFTNKAATEMKERIKNLLNVHEMQDGVIGDRGAGRLPVMGTFHSVCARILRRDIEHLGRNRSFAIYDADDQEKVMKEVLKKLQVDEKELKARAAMGYVGRFKCEALSPKDAQAQATTPRMEKIIQAYKMYQDTLLENNAVDFDDLILETVRLFKEVPEVLDRYQETWRFLHVDEYQDTNHGQYEFISLLAQKYRNLCVIGDPDQSIYAFRGADIRNIMEFEHEYKDAFRVKLEQNYRSTQVVLTAANAVISQNPNRPEKDMWSDKKEGPKVIVHEVRDERKEAEEAVSAIQALNREGMPLNDQVILYRTNAQSRLFEEACMRMSVPYRIVGGVKFYMRKEVKDVLAYLHVLLNPRNTLSLLRILNVPARKIGHTTLEHLQAFSALNSLPLWETLKLADQVSELNEGTKARIHAFTEIIDRFAEKAHREGVYELTEHLIETLNLREWYNDGTDEGEERWNNVQELLSVMHKYDHLEPLASLESFLEEAALVSEVDKLTDVRDDAVTLMTLHLCKGLEFEHVLIGGCEEGIFPHANSAFDKEQLEEERRLMYVGMTRAKKHLRLLFTRARMLYGETQNNPPSRFLDDLPDAVTERRSDELLSAFAWATESGKRKASGYKASAGSLQPYRQQDDFNQDTGSDDTNQDGVDPFQKDARVLHPSFGEGTIMDRRGDVVTIDFDSGARKSFALSIAPLKAI